MSKQAVRPFYEELQALLSQIPAPKDCNEAITEPTLWYKYNSLVDLISSNAGGNDYSRFKVRPESDSFDIRFINLASFRAQIHGLIMNLHAVYYSDEREPFSGPVPSSFEMNVVQNQTVNVQVMLFELRDRIDEILPKVTDTKEKGFLNKIKSAIAPAKDLAQLFNIVFTVAQQFGLSIDELLKIFSYLKI